MNAIELQHVSYRYRRDVDALHDISLTVAPGSIHGLIGPNGAGKSTLLQCSAGLRYATSGTVRVFGNDARKVDPISSHLLGYLSEAIKLPPKMTLARLEAYIAPLHPRWDATLAQSLRQSFGLDPKRALGTLSRGEHMKAAMLCALAPRPKLLLMDEPFTGMDVLVKDEIVRGLLAAALDAGTTILIASHDLAEMEAIVDHVAILNRGRLLVNGSMDALRERYRRVTVVADAASISAHAAEPSWLGVERAGRRISFLADAAHTSLRTDAMQQRFPGAEQITMEEPSLRELFATLARDAEQHTPLEVSV
jgi:ABC-2 type transport system ATP-binding protein